MTDKTVTKAVRLPVEIAEFYGETPLRGVLESIYDLFQEGRVEFDDGKIDVLKTGNGVYTPDCDMAAVEDMVKCSGLNMDEAMKYIRMMLEDGEIKVGKGVLYVDACPFNYDGFMEKCREKGVDPQDAMDKLVRIM